MVLSTRLYLGNAGSSVVATATAVHCRSTGQRQAGFKSKQEDIRISYHYPKSIFGLTLVGERLNLTSPLRFARREYSHENSGLVYSTGNHADCLRIGSSSRTWYEIH